MLNNQGKINQSHSIPQIVAGMMESDNNIEFVGVPENKTVIYLQNGRTKKFTDLPVIYFNIIREAYEEDKNAVEFLSSVTSDFSRQIELYVYYMWGDLDSVPDLNVKELKLSNSENFREYHNCPSLLWNKKRIRIKGKKLDPREVAITDMFADNLPDKTIAMKLGICHSTFDVAKKKLFTKTGVNTKPQYMILATQQKVVINEI